MSGSRNAVPALPSKVKRGSVKEYVFWRVSDEDKARWRKTWTPEDLEALREIKRVFPESELIGVEWV